MDFGGAFGSKDCRARFWLDLQWQIRIKVRVLVQCKWLCVYGVRLLLASRWGVRGWQSKLSQTLTHEP